MNEPHKIADRGPSGDLCPICHQSECDHTDDEMAETVRLGNKPYLASDADAIAEKTRVAKSAASDEENMIRHQMGSREGRKFMWDFFKRAGIMSSSFGRANGDSAWTAFYEGQRNVGNEYLALIVRYMPDAYLAMIKENSAAEKPAAATRRSA